MKHREANLADIPPIRELLRTGGLLSEDCAEQLANFLILEEHDEIIAVGALEVCGAFGLVRSLVVAPAFQGCGHAADLLFLLAEKAQKLGLQALYLLTETSVGYFRKFGFEVLDRGLAPPSIQATRQLGELCPTHAFLMCRGFAANMVSNPKFRPE